MQIRSESDHDREAVHALNLLAFDTPSEADLVDTLRDQLERFISLVAEEDGKVVGHIMFSPVHLSGHPDARLMGLAPMAVEPARQRTGIGSAMVRAGLAQCKLMGYGAVVVLGHPDYYPKFGFSPSTTFDIRCEYDVPEEVFMAIELRPGALSGKSGVVKYHTAFGEA